MCSIRCRFAPTAVPDRTVVSRRSQSDLLNHQNHAAPELLNHQLPVVEEGAPAPVSKPHRLGRPAGPCAEGREVDR